MRSGWSNPSDCLSSPPVKFIITQSSIRTNKYERWRENSYPCLIFSLPIDVLNCMDMILCRLHSKLWDVKQQCMFTELYATLRKKAEETYLTLTTWDVIYVERQITMCEMTEKPGFRNMFQMIWMQDVGIRFPAQHQIVRALGLSCILFYGYK